ncbi:MAG: hypothetical protein A3H95_17495 [Acidobacteria bacterium RIFCSPLOWO2_02_FULL_64_15]|nr:MAG: hypothetical protein A3H95_17495 [Acidobacteria bacterium RIFCSPLOWO2_02_FULL_64_15]
MRKGPPRLIVRTLAVTFSTLAVILLVVFVVLTVDVRGRVRAAETDKLRAGARLFSMLEARRQQDLAAVVSTLTENPTLKAALETYFAESRFSGLTQDQETALRRTVRIEVEKLASLTSANVIALLDTDDRVFTAAGPAQRAWPDGLRVTIAPMPGGSGQGVATVPGGAFRVTGAPLRLDQADIGTLLVGTSLDAAYAGQLAELAGASVVITVEGKPVASTLPPELLAAFTESAEGERRTLLGEEHAVRTLFDAGVARIYALNSIDAATRQATQSALLTLATIALGGIALAAIGSLWLARTLTGPIDRASRTIAAMTAARDFARPLEPTGSSRELDALTEAFNHLVDGLRAAEAESRTASIGAIRALAAALDARDWYTAGHSERVSTLSVAIGRQLQLGEAEIDVLRLGALLHDIGKIGVPDEVLRKPAKLTSEEFEYIKRHPALGARILRLVPFLAPHLPLVELHHERPDGRGYPFGLHAEQIPRTVAIVHVADAFDALTSARAYRPGRPAPEAMFELHRCKGAEFDPAIVDALDLALPGVAADLRHEPALRQLLGKATA